MPQYPSNLSSNLPQVGTTIFTVMSGLANELGAINLSQGFPGFDIDPRLSELVTKSMQAGHNQYAPMGGAMPLREAIAKKMEDAYSIQYNPETEITVTAGATQAIYTAIAATIREGDEVIVFTPAYDCYAPAIELNGGKPVYVQLKTPDYKIDWDEVKKMVNRRTRMIIINTPHNPTGAIMSAQDLISLENLTKGSDILVVSDEVYEHILFDGYEHQSVARFPELANRSFIVYSFGKTFHATGWKVGYCLAPEALTKEFRKAHQFIVFSVNNPVQHALAEYMSNPDTFNSIAAMYQEKRDLFNGMLKDSRFELRPSAGTYFQLLGYSDITDEKDTEYAIRLTREHGVASIPVSVFYNKPVDDKVLRFCFAKDADTLQRAAEILCKI